MTLNLEYQHYQVYYTPAKSHQIFNPRHPSNPYEIDEVENDKAFHPAVGNVNFKFDRFADL
ncbi:MAG: hypothetical protein ABFS56_31315 [Pseudomonadota bacterium]